MPESVTDRPTKAHEYVFLLTKAARYFYDADAVREPQKEFIDHTPGPRAASLQEGDFKKGGFAHKRGGFNETRQEKGIAYNPLGRNLRTVWTIPTQPMPEAHFASFPEKLVERCLLAGCPDQGTVLDPFAGTGTVGRVAETLGRNSILIELNPKYVEIIKRRTAQGGLFAGNA